MTAPGTAANGILVVDKPAGFTSFDVVAKLRGICGTRQIGHGGTLDPMATGVLPVFVGRAAKAVDLAPNQDKAYEAVVLFGTATDTGDVTGTVLEQRPVAIRAAALQAVLPRFLGEQMQTPPMYSAVKVNGKPLYRYAREGVAVERKARPVTIHSLVLDGQMDDNQFRLQVQCSKGTYIRTLLEDIGAALGVPATLAALRRTMAGVFTLADALPLEAIQAAKDAGGLLALYRSTGELFVAYPALQVDDNALARLANGAAVRNIPGKQGLCRLLHNGCFIGLGRIAANETLLVEKLFVELPLT